MALKLLITGTSNNSSDPFSLLLSLTDKSNLKKFVEREDFEEDIFLKELNELIEQTEKEQSIPFKHMIFNNLEEILNPKIEASVIEPVIVNEKEFSFDRLLTGIPLQTSNKSNIFEKIKSLFVKNLDPILVFNKEDESFYIKSKDDNKKLYFSEVYKFSYESLKNRKINVFRGIEKVMISLENFLLFEIDLDTFSVTKVFRTEKSEPYVRIDYSKKNNLLYYTIDDLTKVIYVKENRIKSIITKLDKKGNKQGLISKLKEELKKTEREHIADIFINNTFLQQREEDLTLYRIFHSPILSSKLLIKGCTFIGNDFSSYESRIIQENAYVGKTPIDVDRAFIGNQKSNDEIKRVIPIMKESKYIFNKKTDETQDFVLACLRYDIKEWQNSISSFLPFKHLDLMSYLIQFNKNDHLDYIFSLCPNLFGKRNENNLMSFETKILDAPTLFLLAAEYGNEYIIETFLTRHPNIMDSRNEEGRDAFMIACIHGRINIVNYLLQKNIDLPRKFDTHHNTPMHLASMARQIDIVAILIKHDGSLSYLENKDGALPVHGAALGGSIEILKLFLYQNESFINLEDSMGTNLFLYASCAPDEMALKFLLDLNPLFLYTKDKAKSNAFLYACMNGRIQIANYLLSLSKEYFLWSVNDKGYNAFHLAALKSRTNVLEWLISIDKNFLISEDSNNNNMNAFLIFCQEGKDISTGEWLLSKNPNFLTSENIGGTNPILFSILGNNIKISQWLYSLNKSSILTVNKGGFDALKAALGTKNNDIISWVQEIL